MADQLVTQVERPAAKRSNLVLNIDADSPTNEEVDASVNLTPTDLKNSPDDTTPRVSSSSGRYRALGRMFSRQFTPTIPKKGKNSSSSSSSGAPSSTSSITEMQNSVSTKKSGGVVVDKDDVDLEYELSGLIGRNPTRFKHCLVLDLDETLVHSSFKPIGYCDFVLSINMDNIIHKVYVLKRPGADEFLEEMSKYYELVIFTASLDKYANPLLDLLDPKGLITGRLFREHCTRRGQMYVKDMDKIGRKLENSLIVDNSPHSYALHPHNAVNILTWFDDPNDTELFDMMPFLKKLTGIKDVGTVLDATKPWRASYRKLNQSMDQSSML